MLTIEVQEELVQRAMELAGETAAAGNLPFAGPLADENVDKVLETVNTVKSTQKRCRTRRN